MAAEPAPDASLPEAPDWSAGGSPRAPDSGPASRDGGPAAESPTPGTDEPPAAEVRAAAEGGLQEEELAVGVPANDGLFLPQFEAYGRAWFERNGLRFRVGPVHLRLALGLEAEYNDNIFGASENPQADLITRVRPVIRAGLGDYDAQERDYLLLRYQPSFDSYMENKERDRLNQDLEISGQAEFSRYATEVSLRYVTSDSPNATQSGGTAYSTLNFDWQNRYFLGAKTFAGATLGAVLQDSENNNNYRTYSLSPQLGYAYSPKTTVFIAPFVGLAEIGDGATQTFQGLSLGIEYDNLRKFTLNGSFGVQARQFRGVQTLGAQDFITPVLRLEARWQPREWTSFRLNLVRDVQISDLVRGLTYTNSSVSLGFGQRLFGELGFGVSLGYQLLEYQGEDPVGREENFFQGETSLSYSFLRGALNLSLYYRRQQRTSDDDAFDYEQNAYGIRASYAF